MPRSKRVTTPFSLNFADRNSNIGLYYSAISEAGGRIEEAGRDLQSYFFSEEAAEALVMMSVKLGIYHHLPPHDLLESYCEDEMIISEDNGHLFYSYEQENGKEDIPYHFLQLGRNGDFSRVHPMTLEDIIQTDREIGIQYSYVFPSEEMFSMIPNQWYCWVEGREYPEKLNYHPESDKIEFRTEGIRRLIRDYEN